MSNIQGNLKEKLEKVKNKFIESVENLEREVNSKVYRVKNEYDTKLEKTKAEIIASQSSFLNNDDGDIIELKGRIENFDIEKNNMLDVIKEKDDKINNLKEKVEVFVETTLKKIEKIEKITE